MAAIFLTLNPTNHTLFKSGMAINNSVQIPFLSSLIGQTNQVSQNAQTGILIVTEVQVQNRDTVQYFLTFDDVISYFYFGKGLGTLSISGMVFSDCNNYFGGLSSLTNQIGRIRGTTQAISFGNVVFSAVLSAFTLRSSSDVGSLNYIEFNLQMDIIDHSLPPAHFTSACAS